MLVRDQRERGEAYRDRVKILVSSQDFAEMERRMSVVPDSSEYLADFWHRMLNGVLKARGEPTV